MSGPWRIVDVTDPDDPLFTAWHAADAAGSSADRPWYSVPSLASQQARLAPSLFDRFHAFVALDGSGEVVGAGHAVVNLQGNRHFGWGGAAVPPAHRRQGIGTALLRHAEDVVRPSGATYFLTQTSYPFTERETHGDRRFLESLGYALDLDEIHRTLALPVDPALLDRLAAEAAPAHAAYTVETWVHDVPEEHLDSWIAVHNKLGSDAPSGVVQFEEDGMDRASWLEEADRLRALGRELLTTVAISPDGEVVAYNDLVLQDNDTGRVSQWGTLVRTDHRGRRLGLAVKVRGLQELARRHPDRTEVVTTNAEVNDHMIAINAAVGFRPVAVVAGFYRVL